MRLSVWSALALLAALPTLASAAWRAEGPFAANVNAIAIDAANPSTIYAATSAGGVWRSDDGGASWTLPGSEMTSRNPEWVAVDPGTPGTVWVGLDDPSQGSALWRSTDRGATWAPVADDYPGGTVHATGAPIAFAPTQPKTIYVASSNLHYRSDDGGKSWRDFRVPNQDAYVFAVHPTDPKIVFAGGRGESQNVSRSTDGGKTWRQVGIGLGKTSLFRFLIDPAQPTTLYGAGGTFASVFKSTDNGDRWTELTLPVGGTSDLFDFEISADGKTLWAATEDGLLRSDDGGANWSRSDRGIGGYLLKTIAIDPRDPKRIVAGAGGDGIYVSRDGGASWSASSGGMSSGWVKKLWSDPRSATLFVQMATGLFRRDGNAWAEILDPFASDGEAQVDGFVWDASSPQTIYALDTSKYWRSSDAGRSWQAVEQKEPGLRDMMKGNMEQAQFVSLVQETGNAKVLYAGSWSNDGPGGAIYKSSDAGKKWAPSGNGVPNEKVSLLRAGAPGNVFALVPGEGVFRTADGGKSWSEGSGLPDGEIRDVAVNPKSPQQLFAPTEKGLFRSTDAGASWVRVGAGGGLEDEDVEAVAVDPASGAVYAGAFHGVFRSTDGGESWTAMNDGLPNTDVRALAISGGPARLWAGTAGGSLWSTELP